MRLLLVLSTWIVTMKIRNTFRITALNRRADSETLTLQADGDDQYTAPHERMNVGFLPNSSIQMTITNHAFLKKFSEGDRLIVSIETPAASNIAPDGGD